jgi:hypothetical protein
MAQLNWKIIVELVGIGAIVASLIFVGFQLQQDRRLAAAQVVVAADAVELEILALISQNSEVWLKGLKGEELSAVEEVEFRAVAEAHYQNHLGKYLRINLLGFGKSLADRQSEDYAFDLYQYPLLRRIFTENVRLTEAQSAYLESTFRTGFSDSVNEYLAKFDESKTEIGEKIYFAY